MRGVENRAGLGIAESNVAVEVQAAKVPLRIFKNRLSIICITETCLNRNRRTRRSNPGGPGAGSRFSAGRPSRKDLFARARILRAAIDFFDGIDLRGGEAVRSVCVFAQQYRRIESACSRVAEKAVLQTILAVACGKSAILDQRQLRRRDATARTL